MKYIWKDLYLAGIMGILLPGLLLNVGVMAQQEAEQTQIVTEAVAPEQIIQPEPSVTITMMADSGPVELELEEYLVGVVLAEMPAAFENEALKAQAVVARTYAVRAGEGRSKHELGDICGDSTCCQGYVAPESYTGGEESLEKVRNAVYQTAGQVLTYENELIEATYFSCSGGSTEDAVAVWGTEVPYLQSVESPGEEHAAYFTDSVSFTLTEIQKALGLDVLPASADWLGKVTYTAGGGVESITLGGKNFSGTQVRKLLGLRSTAFTMKLEDNTVTVFTKGYGHRVGMSQYGADAMAASGSTYGEILAHFYQGTALVNWFD